ncbi:MAG: hypothetical protein JWP03_3141 [Phycisphaerales bacterium]|nr:hypothetical protein [Phycisphaerales bacterium]
MADATLFEVRTVRGIVYAIHDPSTGMVWTERTEQSARLLAADKGLAITLKKSISQDGLLALSGRDVQRPASKPSAVQQPPRSKHDDPPKVAPLSAGRKSSQPSPAARGYHWDDDLSPTSNAEPAIFVGSVTQPQIRDVFASEVPPEAPAGENSVKGEDVAGEFLTRDEIHISPAAAKSLKQSQQKRPGNWA